MERQEFVKVMQDVLDSLPEEFRSRICNVAVLVEDFPPGQPSSPSHHPKKLKEAPSGALPWGAHDQEECLRPADRA
jgi:hypothetical protein